MPIDWRLKQALASQGILNASQLERALEVRLGIRLSRAGLDKLLKNQPAQIRLETMQILCNLLQAPLESFLTVTPEPIIRQPVLIQPYGKSEKPGELLMVDPSRFF